MIVHALLYFSSNTPHGNAALIAGRIFGRRLSDLSKLLVSLEDRENTDVLVPKLIVSACKYIEDNVEIEGIYRLSGSSARQKVGRDCYVLVVFNNTDPVTTTRS